MIKPIHSCDHKHNPVKTASKIVTGSVATAAVAAAALAVGAKTGKFNVSDTTNKHLAKVLPHLKTAGDFINQKASTVATKLHLNTAIKKVGGVAKKVVNGVKKVVTTIADKVKNVFTSGKAKEVAEKTVETMV